MDPAQQARMQDAFFAYARCMRSKGVNMPDPKVTGNGVTMQVQGGPGNHGTGSGPPPESPAFKTADSACHHFLAQVEKTFGSGGKKLDSAGPSQQVAK
jgi:hypothetical protein